MELINEALVMQSSLASLNQPSHVDDIIATLQLFSNQYLNSQTHLSQPPTLTDCNTFRSHYLSELYRLVGLHLDYTGDAPLHQLITSSIIQRCLSVQAALGYAGDIGGRSLSAIVAWTMLNTRSIALAFIQLVSKKPAGGENELGKPGLSDFLQYCTHTH